MKNISTLLACLAWAVNGRRLQASMHPLKPSQALARLIRKLRPAAAFNPSASGAVSLPGKATHRMWSQTDCQGRCTSSVTMQAEGPIRHPSLSWSIWDNNNMVKLVQEAGQASTEAEKAVWKAKYLASSGTAVAEWAVVNKKPQATVAVSQAEDIAEVLRDFWKTIRIFGEELPPENATRVLAFPLWRDGTQDPDLFSKVFEYLEACSENSQFLDENMLMGGKHPVQPSTEEEPERPPTPMIVLKVYKQKQWKSWEEEFGKEYAADPFGHLPSEPMLRKAQETATDAELLAHTRAWVEGVIVHMKVCPFSSTADQAGIPVGGVSYPITHGSTAEEIYEAFWEQVIRLSQTDEHDLATILLLTPNFAVKAPGVYDAIADTLNTALTKLGVEDDIQLVFFHPQYTFRDGQSRMNDDSAANYARRSPYPMINLLRTPQVRAAQKNIPTGAVYITNEQNMKLVGGTDLHDMLEKRDWTGLYEKKYIKHKDNLWKSTEDSAAQRA